MIFGIDYASVDGNKPPGLVAAKAAGLRFAFVRADYSTWPDPVCGRDRHAIRAAGLIFGAYLFPVMDAGSPSPEDQVAVFVRNAQLYSSIDMPAVLDLEWPKGVAATGRTREQIANWIYRARVALRKAYGIDPMIYSSARVLDGSDSDAMRGAADDAIRGCPAWCARYRMEAHMPALLDASKLLSPPVPRALGDSDGWWIHQYQGDAIQLPGFSATVDMDRFNRLALGAHGSRVAWVRRRVGLIEGRPAFWEEFTQEAVLKFQASRGLVADGIVGPATFAALSWVRVNPA